jgi:DNA-binding NtrC family response regulator
LELIMPKAPDPNDPLKRELDQIRLQLGEAESAEDDPAVKIVLATGHAMEEDAHDLMKAGALRFVQKPFAVQQLSDALSAAFGSTRNTHDDC